MVKVEFRFKDEFTKGEWRTRTGTYESLEQCISMNGLNECESEIISVVEIG